MVPKVTPTIELETKPANTGNIIKCCQVSNSMPPPHVFSDADPDVPVVLEREVVEEDVLVAAAGHGDLGVARVLAGVLRLLPRLVAVQPLRKESSKG